MFERKYALDIVKMLACASASAMLMGACVSVDSNSGTTAVTPQGTVDLDKVKAGMPETIFKAARITFAVDTHPEASKGGKTQYLSRTYNAKNGQYVAQCKDEKCYELQVLYNPPVSKEDGIATLATILPADAPAETAVDDSVLKDAKNPRTVELHYFGNKYFGILTYSDKAGKQVQQVYGYALPPELALMNEYGKIPPGLKIPQASRVAMLAGGKHGHKGRDAQTTEQH